MPQIGTKQNVIEPLDPKAGMVEMVKAVENKKRNLEKRKQKLEALQSKTELTEQQQEAVSHIGEVNGNIQYVEEILTRFREIQLQVDKWVAIEAKKEKLANKRKQNNSQSKSDTGSATQRVESVGNGKGPGNDASADVTPTPQSRDSVCEVPQNTAEQSNSPDEALGSGVPELLTSNASAGDIVANDSGNIIPPQEPSELLQPLEGNTPVDEEGLPPNSTVTYVNSAAEGASLPTADGMQSDARGTGHRGSRRGYRHYDGPRGDFVNGPRYGRPPRRGGPYRGGHRGPPRGAPYNAQVPHANDKPQSAAASEAN